MMLLLFTSTSSQGLIQSGSASNNSTYSINVDIEGVWTRNSIKTILRLERGVFGDNIDSFENIKYSIFQNLESGELVQKYETSGTGSISTHTNLI